MKIGNITLTIFFCVALLFNTNNNKSYAQLQIENVDFQNLMEDVELITDKDIYCIYENICFSAYNLSGKEIKDADWSKVLYIEIITPSGKPVAQSKFEYDKDGAAGSINIPKEVLTGNYYLRAYTRWMRNYSPYSYFYKLVKIINPFNKELLNYSDEGIKVISIGQKKDSLSNTQIQISTNKKVYDKRELVEVIATLVDDIDSSIPVSISVAKKESFLQKEILKDDKKINTNIDSAYYLPETRGLTLTGRIVDATDSLPIKNAQVNLTIFNNPTKSYSISSTNNGQFFFSIPHMQGNYEVFASINETFDEKQPIMMVDNDFCTKSISLPFIPIDDNESKNKFLNEMSFNTQMEQFYADKVFSLTKKDSSKVAKFYGQPSYTIELNDYIGLPTMQDYFVELLTNVGIRKKEDKRYFKISGIFPELSLFEPLVLVDFVPVSNVEWVLSISPKKIKKIDIVEAPFIRGNMIFGGIISIISNDGDFAGVNLPSNGQFFHYAMYTEKRETLFELPVNKRVPYLRNVLYWNSKAKLRNDEKLKFEFMASDASGEYYIVLNGCSNQGEKITSYLSFEVK